MNATSRPRRVVVGLAHPGMNFDPVLTAALDQASWSAAELHVVHTLPVTLPTAAPQRPDVRRKQLLDRQSRVQAAASDLRLHVGLHTVGRHAETPVRYEVQHGDPATMLLMAARGADLLVVGAPAANATTRRSPFLLGTVSQDVTVNATCSVLLVPISQ